MKKTFFTVLFILLLVFAVLPAQVYADAGGAADTACETGLRSLNLTPWAVICGAGLDAINPCEFSVLILLMATMLALENNRRRALLSGFSFIAAVFISYFLMGIGLLEFLRNYTLSFSDYFYKFTGGLAILIGLFNIKDYFWHGGLGFVMEVPKKWRPKMKEMIRGVTSPFGALIVGFVVSLFLLPCTSGPYVVILGLLAAKTTFFKAFLYLILYNLIFILPMLIIVLAIYYGLPPERAEAWRQTKIRLLHLIAGLILLALGILILGGWL